MVAGALAGYLALAGLEDLLPLVIALAAGSLLYVALADLMPSLHRRHELPEALKQIAMIVLGIAVIAGAGRVLG